MHIILNSLKYKCDFREDFQKIFEKHRYNLNKQRILHESVSEQIEE